MDIQKSTYVDADDKTTKELTFDLLAGLHNKMDNFFESHESHKGICNDRFKKLENRTKLNTATSAGAGLIGGFIAQISGWFK